MHNLCQIYIVSGTLLRNVKGSFVGIYRIDFYDMYYFRLMIENFWSDECRLPGNTVDRLVAILEAMYSPSSEHHFLAYATSLLLEMTSRSPDYRRHIFEHPLSECKFKVLFHFNCFGGAFCFRFTILELFTWPS